jgi:flagellin
MSLRINTNIEAFDAHRQLAATDDMIAQSMERLSSGKRINRAADDAAGLAITEKLQGQVTGLEQAQRNAQDAVSLVQTAEGSLQEVHSMLQRVRELAVEYQNGTLSSSDKAAIQSEVDMLASEIERIGESAQFNGISLLSSQATITFQVGAMDGEVISVTMISLGQGVAPGIFDFATGGQLISQIDAAIDNVSAERSQFGAVENRLNDTLSNLAIYDENLQSSESRISDVDMASEMSNFTKLQILEQSGTAMLAQANQLPQTVLQLLKG